MVHRLRFGQTGQTLSFTPMRRQAVTWALEDLTIAEQNEGRTLQSGSITSPTAGAPLSAESGPSTGFPDRMFTSTTVEVGEMLRVASAETGASELVVVAGFVAGQYLTTLHPLTAYYPAGSTVDRLRVTTEAIEAAIVSDRDRLQRREPMRVVWTQADGERHQEQVWLVRNDHGDVDVPRVLETARTLYPDLSTRMEHHGKDALEPIVVLLHQRMRSQLSSRGFPIEQYLAGDEGRFLLAYAVLRHLAAMGIRPGNTEGTDWREFLDGEYEACIASITTGPDGHETQQAEPVHDTVPHEKPTRRHFRGL